MTHMTPDAAQSKRLRNQHPLYQKLSGDVVWVLYEERGFAADACGKAMDDIISVMHSTLAVMQALESGEAQHFMVQGEVRAAQCATMAGRIFAASGPQWRDFLPPYAVGCSLSCQAIAKPAQELHGEACGHSPQAASAADLRPPSCGLFCPCL